MGLTEEYERAREWVKDLSFDVDDKYHNFEVNFSHNAAKGAKECLSDLIFVCTDHDPCIRWASGSFSPLGK